MSKSLKHKIVKNVKIQKSVSVVFFILLIYSFVFFDVEATPTFVYDGENIYVYAEEVHHKLISESEVPRVPYPEQNSWRYDFEAPYKGCSKTLKNMRKQQESYKHPDGSYKFIDLLKYTPKEITLKVLPAFEEHMSPFKEIDFIWNSEYMKTAWKNYEKLKAHAKEQKWLD